MTLYALYLLNNMVPSFYLKNCSRSPAVVFYYQYAEYFNLSDSHECSSFWHSHTPAHPHSLKSEYKWVYN